MIPEVLWRLRTPMRPPRRQVPLKSLPDQKVLALKTMRLSPGSFSEMTPEVEQFQEAMGAFQEEMAQFHARQEAFAEEMARQRAALEQQRRDMEARSEELRQQQEEVNQRHREAALALEAATQLA